MDRGKQTIVLALAVVGSITWLVLQRSVTSYLVTTVVVGIVALRSSRWLADREEGHRTGEPDEYAPPPAVSWPDGL